ncbi:MAG: hypothetical protein HY064_03700 [Bacteroidetes bacterium]|nr:hypothetical protein [Bacteroidota bacterium]
MQAKLKGQIDELTAAKNPSAKFYVAYYAMKGIAIAMNPLALFIMPSVDSLWSIYVKGKLGYYTYLYNLGNKYIEKENAQTGKTETVQNKDYKAGGYAEVFGNQMKNMINPMFLWGEIKGIFKGIGNWFVDLWEMIKFLGKMFWGGITDTWDLLVHQKPPSWMESIAKGASSAGKWFNENGKAVMSELGKLLGDPEKLRSTVKDLKAALKTGAEGLAYSAGEGIAGIQVKVMSMSAEAQGEMFGKVIGYLIPEIVIAVFSDTIVNWLKGGVKALQAFWKTVQASRAMAKIFEGARWVVQMFEKLGLMFKRIGGTMGRMFDEVMEFFRGIMKWEKEVPKSPIRKISLRQQYLGKTPGKFSKTGREVIERMRNEVPPKIRTDFNGKLEFMASDKKWYSIEEADMSHLTDAVTWWNKTGRNFGAKSPEIRNWMLDSKNYVLDHFSINRSAGARLGETYLPPLK